MLRNGHIKVAKEAVEYTAADQFLVLKFLFWGSGESPSFHIKGFDLLYDINEGLLTSLDLLKMN